MITSFYTNNYGVFKDSVFIDFNASSNTEHTGSLINKNGKKILPVIAFYGANASGKTTLMHALKSAIAFIRMSLVLKSEDGSMIAPYNGFLFVDDFGAVPTEYEITFIVDEFELKLYFSVNPQKVLEESLYYRKIGDKSFIRIYDRNVNSKTILGTSKHIDADEWKFIRNCVGMAQDDELLITLLIMRAKKSKLLLGIKSFIYSIQFMEVRDSRKHLSFNQQSGLLDFYNGEKKADHLRFIQKADPCITDIYAEQEAKNGSYEILMSHKCVDSNEVIKVPSSFESTGTLNVIAAYPHINYALENGGVFVADELDSSVHPLLLKKIIDIFMDPKTNPHGAQLICTLHNVVMLDKKYFRRDQIWFVEKNEIGISEAYSLDDIEINGHKVRADADYCKNYILGKFGATPQL